MNIKANTNKANMIEDLVSIIMPTYNCGDFIGYTIDSVIAQTYQQWELIIIDDCSTDNTIEVINTYLLSEPRIKYFQFDKNSGAATARNKGVNLAQGRYMAFLDSDDIWFSNKLSKQITFMKKNKYSFTCTSYTKIDENGNNLNRIIKAIVKSDYETILKKNPGNSTVIYDAKILGKFQIPNIKKRNDYVMWLQVIKRAESLYGILEPLGSHRIRAGSLSKNKTNLVGYHWKVYREIEHLSLIKSIYLIAYWIIATMFKLR